MDEIKTDFIALEIVWLCCVVLVFIHLIMVVFRIHIYQNNHVSFFPSLQNSIKS